MGRRNIGSYIFEAEAGHNVTANEERYRTMTNDFFVPELEDFEVDLPPLDYFFLGYVKSLVYVDRTETIKDLKDDIRLG